MANSTPIDELTIEIDANANDANNAIDSLCKKIDILTTSISKVDVGKLNSLGNGIKRLGDSLQTMKSIDARGVNTVVNKINSLSAIDTSKFATVSANLHQMANGIQSLGTVSANAVSVGDLASNISKLGNKSVQTAVANIPQLATALKGLMAELSQLPKVSQNVIQMTNALVNLTAQGSKVGRASSSIVKGLNRASASAERSKKRFKGLASAFGTFYANCFLVIRGLKSLWGSIEGTADYLEAFNYFEVALNKVGGDWSSQYEKYGYANAEAYANSFKTRLNESLKGLSGVQISIDANGETGLLTDTGLKNLGLNIQEVTQYASQLASVTNSVGQTGEVTLATASAFTKLGADMSSLFNVDYSSVMNNLQSGLIGQSRALYKYGIDITNATLQTYAYGLGVEKAVSEMTQAEKMQLRMIAILDQSRVSWGDQANTINSLSNSIRQFKNNISEAGQILGQLFVPIFSKIMPIVNGVTIAIKRLMVSIAGLFGIKLDLSEFGQGTSNVADEMGGLSDSLDDATSSAEKLKKATTTLGIDELNINSPQTDTSSGNAGGVSGGGIDLTDSILKATEEYEKAWQEAYERMENKSIAFADRITQALEPVKKIFEDISVGDWFAVGEDTSNLVVGIFDFFANAIDSVDWYGIGTKIGDFLAGINWIDVFRSVGNLMWQGLKVAFELAIGSFETAPLETAIIGLLLSPAIVDFGSKIIGFIVDPFENAFKLVEPIFLPFSSKITEMFALWTGGAETFGESFMAVFGTGGIVAIALGGLAIGLGVAYAKNEEVRESFANATQEIKDGFQPAVEFITDTLLPDLQDAWERLEDILSPFSDFLNDVFVSIWQDMINPALTYIGETVLPMVTGAFENLWNDVLVPLGNFLADVLEPVIQIVSDVLTMLWENVVVPLANAIGNILGKAFEGLVAIFNETVVPILNEVIAVFQFLWDNVFSPIVDFLWDTFKPIFETVFESIGAIIDGLSRSFGGLIDFVVGVFTLNWEKAWSGVKDIFGGIFDSLVGIVKIPLNLIIGLINGLLSGIETGINFVIRSVNKLSFDVPKWVPEIGGKKFGFNLKETSFSKVQYLATGGFPEDGWFRASKGEYFGQFDDGTSYIANNNQITNGIAIGVKQAVAEVMYEMYTPYLAEIAQNTKETANKDMSVNIGDREIYKASVRGGKSFGKLLIT